MKRIGHRRDMILHIATYEGGAESVLRVYHPTVMTRCKHPFIVWDDGFWFLATKGQMLARCRTYLKSGFYCICYARSIGNAFAKKLTKGNW
jgi:hypothetical protein